MGNGDNTFVWFGNWHPLGPLYDRFGNRVIYDSRLLRNALVKNIIHHGSWKWLAYNSIHLIDIKNYLILNL